MTDEEQQDLEKIAAAMVAIQRTAADQVLIHGPSNAFAGLGLAAATFAQAAKVTEAQFLDVMKDAYRVITDLGAVEKAPEPGPGPDRSKN